MDHIKIISEGGMGYNTVVLNSKTGQPIEGVRSVTFRATVKELTTAELDIVAPAIYAKARLLKSRRVSRQLRKIQPKKFTIEELIEWDRLRRRSAGI